MYPDHMIHTVLRAIKKLLPTRLANLYRQVFAGDNPPLDEFYPIQNGKTKNFSGGDFGELLSNHSGRRISKWIHFINIYEELLAPYKNAQSDSSNPLRLLEIGVAKGGSLEIWKKYFGENALIYGIDIDEKCREITIPGVHIRIGSQVDEKFLDSIIAELGSPQIIIDDGSHHSDHLSLTLQMLWPQLQDGGIYIIEDTHTSYWKDHGGGYLKSQTIIEFVKDAVDTIHHSYTRKQMPSRTEFLKDSLSSITFYDSIIVLRKSKTSRPQRVSFE